MSAITHVHVGSGKSYGDVDQPIIRDPLGVPFIPGSSIKGALKSKFLIEKNCVEKCNGDCEQEEKCEEECYQVYCLFGPERGDKGASRIVVADFYPLFVPMPSLSSGYVYVTSNFLLQYAETLNVKLVEGKGESEEIFIGTQKIKAEVVRINERIIEIHPFLKNFYRKADGKGYVTVYKINDKHLFHLIDRALLRLTRVKIERTTKTAERNKLWTEEYLPHGTILVGAFVYRPWRNACCEKCKHCENLLEELNDIFFVVGGKETIGKGLARIKVMEGA